MKSERDSIRVGRVSIRRYWRKGWLLPDGSYTMNPLTAQYAAEAEHNRRNNIEQRRNVTALTIKRKKMGPKQSRARKITLRKLQSGGD